jgi:ABC-type phosphate transport system auxiliary subunit
MSISFKEILNDLTDLDLYEDSEDVTTKQDIYDLIEALDDDYGEENVDYDEIMEVLLDYISSKYDVEDEDESLEEKKVEYFDTSIEKIRRDKKKKLNKFQLAQKAKSYYRKNRNKLKKKMKKYRKKVKSGKIVPKQHDRFQRKK